MFYFIVYCFRIVLGCFFFFGGGVFASFVEVYETNEEVVFDVYEGKLFVLFGGGFRLVYRWVLVVRGKGGVCFFYCF